MRSKSIAESELTDHDLLIRIDERVASLQGDMETYKRDVESLKKRVYGFCGGLAVIQFAGPVLGRVAGFLTGTHSGR